MKYPLLKSSAVPTYALHYMGNLKFLFETRGKHFIKMKDAFLP